MNALVWPVATYGCESWTIENDEEKRLGAFEMKALKKIMGVSWTAKKTNEWVLNKGGIKTLSKARKLEFYGHITRKQGSSPEKEIMQGTMPGAQRRERPHTAWMDNIRGQDSPWKSQIKMTEDRDKWRKYVHGVANPRIEDR